MKKLKRTRSWARSMISAGTAALTILLLSSAARASTVDPRQPAFRAIAMELLAGIDGASLVDIPAAGGYGKPRIAVVPFHGGQSGITTDIASEFNSWLLAELTRQGGGNYRFVAREALATIIGDIDRLGELDREPEGQAADLLRNARVDILIMGTLRRDGPAAHLSYKAISVEDGIVFIATQPRWIALAAPPHMQRRHRMARHDDVGDVIRDPQRVVARDQPFRPARRPIFRAQRMLMMLGYSPGPTDGVMRPALRRAIADFQRNIGVAVTGRMTRQLIRQLRRNLLADGRTAQAFPATQPNW